MEISIKYHKFPQFTLQIFKRRKKNILCDVLFMQNTLKIDVLCVFSHSHV